VIVASVVVVLCGAGAAVGGFALYRSIHGSNDAARAAVGAFLGGLETGELDSAYDQFCARTRDRYTRADFARLIDARPRLSNHAIVGTSRIDEDGLTSEWVAARLRYADGSSEIRFIAVSHEGGAWYVCGDPY